ncbi:MAG: ribosome silencing factor [Alistipes sp.]|nr:ribosome silencing factor [Candidatus Alistipes equi]
MDRESRKLVKNIVQAIQDKKGKNIVSLDISKFDGAICSVFVVCNADSTTQVCSIADGIDEKLRETINVAPWRIEGQQTGMWIAMDYIDVVVHIFQTPLRDYYKLEDLWADAKVEQYESEE